jgi:hypothetical protein
MATASLRKQGKGPTRTYRRNRRKKKKENPLDKEKEEY